jgi:hypothetical protein
MTTEEFFAEAKRLGLRMLGTPEETRAALDAKDVEIDRLTAALDEARAEASVAYLAFEQVKVSRAELRKAIAALLDDDDHDTAKALARVALKRDKP